MTAVAAGVEVVVGLGVEAWLVGALAGAQEAVVLDAAVVAKGDVVVAVEMVEVVEAVEDAEAAVDDCARHHLYTT